MKTLCYSVRLQSLYPISEKAYKAISFDGSEDIIPKSCVFGQDYDVIKSDAYWVAAWILPKKKIQYTSKKQCWFDESGRMLPTYNIEKHSPEKISPIADNTIKELIK
jgi:hypothetical protein